MSDERELTGMSAPAPGVGGVGGVGVQPVTAVANAPLAEPDGEPPALGDAQAGSGAGPVSGSGRQRVWRQDLEVFVANRLAVAGLVFLVLIVLFCFVGPLVYSSNQSSATLLNANLAPSSQFPLGTDINGFDILGRLMVGGRSTLEIGLAVAVLSTGFGALWGAVAGYVGGVVDSILMRIVDTMLSIPFLLFAVLIATILTPTLPLIILAITVVSWPSTARIVRGETLSLRTRDYVTAAAGFGSWHLRLIGRHVLPNSVGSIIVNATLKVATAILLAAALSFLGLTVPPPATTWGRMITSGIDQLNNGYWWELWPAAAAIVLTVIAVNVIGDGLYDVIVKRQVTEKS
jgi:ABC-type dipeptide/oligopeptide/nickel transport system permease subunit